jgi:hypothetical protein
MKNISSLLLFLALPLLFCPLFAKEQCIYSYDPAQTVLEWTAFKFTEKTGVKGKLDRISVKNTKKMNSVLDSLKDLTFSIQTDSVNSNNPDRDGKIKTYFFGSIKNAKDINGNFSKITGEKVGTAQLNLQFGKTKHAIPVTYEIIDDSIEMKGSLDVTDLALEKGLAKLNEVCTDLHKGSDGISKLWPTVDLRVSSKLSKVCKP